MSFHLVTRFGHSTQTFSNAENFPNIGQGVLQGSSSACPIYIFNSDICLSTYKKHSTRASFIHPISGWQISNHAVQFVDDTTQFINPSGIPTDNGSSTLNTSYTTLFHCAQRNIDTWNNLIWFSGGKLNPQKCHSSPFDRRFNFKKFNMEYHSITPKDPLLLHDRNNQHKIQLDHRNQDVAKRTLGVFLAPTGSAPHYINGKRGSRKNS